MFHHREPKAATPTLGRERGIIPLSWTEPLLEVQEGTSRLGLDETVELLAKVLRPKDEDFPPRKTKLEVAVPVIPPAYTLANVEIWTRT